MGDGKPHLALHHYLSEKNPSIMIAARGSSEE